MCKIAPSATSARAHEEELAKPRALVDIDAVLLNSRGAGSLSGQKHEGLKGVGTLNRGDM